MKPARPPPSQPWRDRAPLESTVAAGDGVASTPAAGGEARGIERPCRIWRNYPGAKSGAGVFQTIVNQIPPHRIWVEAFCGSGAVTRALRPGADRFVIDSDPQVIRAWKDFPGVTAVCADALEWLRGTRFGCAPSEVVVYCDPPYLREVRSCKRDYYRHEFAEEAQHRALIDVLRGLPACVILSGYASGLYERLLGDWRKVQFQTVNRRGKAVTEWLWLNFPAPTALHDYRYLGANYRERERIRRKIARWQGRLLSMPALERYALLSALDTLPNNLSQLSNPHEHQ